MVNINIIRIYKVHLNFVNFWDNTDSKSLAVYRLTLNGPTGYDMSV